MINRESIETNTGQTRSPSHLRPDYKRYNFANIPGSILNLFDIAADNQLPAGVLPDIPAVEKVIFLFVDAFGWNLFQRFVNDSAVLQRFLRNGVVSQLTSQFPSTTTAHVTTMHTNRPVGQHGMFEWNYYEPAADAVISPFSYSFAGDTERGSLQAAGLEPAAIFPRQSIYPLLTQNGIASYLFNYQAFAASPYNGIMDRNATFKISFAHFPQALNLLSQAVLQEKGRAYYYLYWGNLDALRHTHGPDSEEARIELQAILQAVESRLLKPLSSANNTLLLISADHGQTDIDPARTVYLNHLVPDIVHTFKTTRSGRPIVPGGSCRSFFLYVKEEQLEEVHVRLQRKLNGMAQVLRVDSLIKDGYFGLPVSDIFLARVGNLVIVPNPGESVWWYEAGKFEVGWYGFHGGLSQDEMLIPLLALPLGQ